jgi:hypothetical protein
MNVRITIVLLLVTITTGLARGPRLASAADPADLPRAEICLNGTWETVLNVDDSRVPHGGWIPRRVPELPLVGATPPAVSAWYRHSIRLPRPWSRPDRRFLLTLDKVGHHAAVYCNGVKVAEHFGQFTPFEADLTEALRAGEANEIAIFAHNASGKYARPGAVLDDPMEGNAYRGATDRPAQRNWVGIVGDIVLSWRPAACLSGVRVIPSVRNKRLEARVEATGLGADLSPWTVRASVIDGNAVIVQLPERPLRDSGSGATSLEAGWGDPVLWGPEPYGTPKLYSLRTELLRGGQVIDRRFTRFGFREVWVEGRDVLLNGKKLWMAGTYYGKLAPIRYLNDRHPQALAIEVMQASGLNTLHGHWDDLGESWLDACDERGMLVLAGFYCDGRPQIQSRADPGWEDWMADTCTRWLRTVRNHPSIVIWRPMDIGPNNVMNHFGAFASELSARVRREDGTRPLVFAGEGNEIDSWAQSPLRNPGTPGVYDDGSRMAERFTGASRPFLTKEIYTGFADVDNLGQFFRTFYDRSYSLGGTGVIVQHLPLVQRDRPFRITWPSESGRGNREAAAGLPQGTLPNWCDPSEPAWTPTPYSRLFRELYARTMKQDPVPARGEPTSEILVTGMAADDLAILLPRDSDLTACVGTRAAADGTAWIVAPRPGEYVLCSEGGSQMIHAPASNGPRQPGYDDVERIAVTVPGRATGRPGK